MTMMIATFRGFVGSCKTINNRAKLEFTPDVRQALTFLDYQAAERFIAPHSSYWQSKKSKTPYFAILCSAGLIPQVVQAVAAAIEPPRALLLQ